MQGPLISRLFYVSEAAAPIGESDARAILAISRRNNRRLDVTGCLLFSGRHFAQALEGAPDVVAPLAARIAADARHRKVRFVLERGVERRRYGAWAMGYVHRLDLAGKIEALVAGAPIDAEAVLGLLEDIGPDTVAGAL